eukprot:CAMPEP_0119094770 /NCGR_PEP_ID=MMETSP1178-20130426/167318_1 /TAXON_ID=33656 /ORGANISM="unid sp, Strain CCMP2000" /LENGTH=59 /DNA_ID=CAMNT_0007078525 /DNA_START=32 /DNA_END=208 /DNA_ORIENTATION=-
MRQPPRTKQPEDVSMILASMGGSRPPTGCSRATSASRHPTAQRPGTGTTRPGSAASRGT